MKERFHGSSLGLIGPRSLGNISRGVSRTALSPFNSLPAYSTTVNLSLGPYKIERETGPFS
jgi:hypothetical protein